MPDRDLLYKITSAVYAEFGDADEEKVERLVTGIYRAIEPFVAANGNSAAARSGHSGAQTRLVISVFGLDHSGIVSEVSNVLAGSGCSIIDINQTLVGDKFAMVIVASMSDMNESIGALKEKFKALGEKLGVRIYAQREDLFNSMHRI
jgi:ACT domain-containing protein